MSSFVNKDKSLPQPYEISLDTFSILQKRKLNHNSMLSIVNILENNSIWAIRFYPKKHISAMSSCPIKWLVGLCHDTEQIVFSPRSLNLSQNSPTPKHFQIKVPYLWPSAPENASGFLTPLGEGSLLSPFGDWKSSADPERGNWEYGKLFLTSGLLPAAFFLYSAWVALFHPLGHSLKLTSSERRCLNTLSNLACLVF